MRKVQLPSGSTYFTEVDPDYSYWNRGNSEKNEIVEFIQMVEN